jgi:hypothetical protein
MEHFEYLPTPMGCVVAIKSRETNSRQIKGKQLKAMFINTETKQHPSESL